MHIQEIFTNPLVLALIAALITYGYFYWDAQEAHKKNPKAPVEPISIVTPIIVGLLVFVLAYNLFPSKATVNYDTNQMSMQQTPQTQAQAQCNKFIDNHKLTDGLDSATFHLVGKNQIRLPQTDVFIDLAKF